MQIYTYPDTDLSDDPWASLTPVHLRLLEQSWAGVFRQHLQPHLPVEALAACFTKTGGRPRKDYALMLGILIFQQLHDLTDAKTVEAIACNLTWHYALGLPPHTPFYICERTLRNYRRVVREHGLAPRLFQQLTDVLLQHGARDTSHQRIDSTTVRSAVRPLTRVGIIVETVSKFLRELARYHPTLYASVAPEVIRLSVERRGDGCFALTKAGETQRRVPEAVAVLGTLCHPFGHTAATTLPSYQVLTRVLAAQCTVSLDQAGHPIVQSKAPAEVPCESVQHPADPDSRYNAHRGQGYLVQIMETYAEDDTAAQATPTEVPQPDVITHVAVQKMTYHDAHALMPAIADVSRRQWRPTCLLGDSHYGSTEHVEQLKTEGLTLLAPAMPPKGSKQGQLTLEAFTLDEVGRVIACPQGHAPVWTSVSEAKLAVRFDPGACQGCPYRDQCPGAHVPQATGEARWQYTHECVAQRARRLAEQLPAFKNRYRWRAGIEATMSRLKHQMHLARLRVRGMVAIQYTVFLRALGLLIPPDFVVRGEG